MAARRKPKPKKLRFEVTKSGVAGIGVIAFCLFLWMFLLGIWVGQTMLKPADATKNVTAAVQKIQLKPLVIKAEKKPVKKAD